MPAPAVSRPAGRADGGQLERQLQGNDLPVVVDFWAPWCRSMQNDGPGVQQAAASLAGEIVVAKLDTEAAPEIAGRFGIRSIPTLIAFDHGSRDRAPIRRSGSCEPGGLESVPIPRRTLPAETDEHTQPDPTGCGRKPANSSSRPNGCTGSSSVLASPGRAGAVWEPPIDVFEDDREVGDRRRAARVPADRVDVTPDEGELVIRAERVLGSSGRVVVHQLEIPYGRFERRIRVPGVRARREARVKRATAA
jgi:thiol-disulfide isomerase/thioredoxin